MTNTKRINRRERRSYIKCAAAQLDWRINCSLWYSESPAGFRVSIPGHLIQAEREKRDEEYQVRFAALDEDAYAAAVEKADADLVEERNGLTVEEAVAWLRQHYDKAAALAKARFEEECDEFLAACAEYDLADLIRQDRIDAAVRAAKWKAERENEPPAPDDPTPTDPPPTDLAPGAKLNLRVVA
jgi:hypothetical protein